VIRGKHTSPSPEPGRTETRVQVRRWALPENATYPITIYTGPGFGAGQ